MSSEHPTSLLRSLRFRTAAAFAGIFAASTGLLFLLFAVMLERIATRHVDALLLPEARRILDIAARRKPRIVQSEVDRFARHYGRDTVYLRVVSTSGVTVATSDPTGWPSADLPLVPVRPQCPVWSQETGSGIGRIRTVTLTDEAGQTARISRSFDAVLRDLRRSVGVLAAAFAMSLAIGTAIAYFLTAGVMSRIERVRLAAEAIAAGDLASRMPPAEGGDEVARLARTFNRMIERIRSVVEGLQTVTDSMAHDVRTPLTRMRAAAEMALTAGTPPPQQSEALASVLEECDRLERMSATLLQIVRLDGGVYVPARDLVDLGELVAQAAELLEPAFEDKGIILDTDRVRRDIAIRGDRPLLERVAANLLDNALKFTPAGGRVTLVCARTGEATEFSVADTGIGIDAKDLPRVFERFYRSDRSRAVAGSGLGLSFVRSAVRAHGGTVRVESEPGKGSTFTVALPSTRTG